MAGIEAKIQTLQATTIERREDTGNSMRILIFNHTQNDKFSKARLQDLAFPISATTQIIK